MNANAAQTSPQILLDLKKKIEDAKREKAQHEGALKQLVSQLAHDYGCKTVEDAEKALKRLDEEIAREEKALDAAVRQLEADVEASLGE